MPYCSEFEEAARGELQWPKSCTKLMLTYCVRRALRPCPLALADRDRRTKLEPSDLTAWFFGDPLPGMSALDLRRRNERTPLKSNFETAGQKRQSLMAQPSER